MTYASKGLVVGVCGGMQMLGTAISDLDGMEHAGTIPGLGLLAIHTTMQPQKLTRMSRGQVISPTLFGQPLLPLQLSGYEIHLGMTEYLEGSEPFALLQHEPADGDTRHTDGCIAPGGRVFGSYLHGLFDEDDFRHAFLAAARAFYGLSPITRVHRWKQQREEALDRLADTVEGSLDMPELFRWAGLSYKKAQRWGQHFEA